MNCCLNVLLSYHATLGYIWYTDSGLRFVDPITVFESNTKVSKKKVR